MTSTGASTCNVPDAAAGAAKWSKYVGLKRILNAIDDDTGEFSTMKR
jgi:hypothetical protein